MEGSGQSAQPTAEELQQGMEVSVAGAQAAAQSHQKGAGKEETREAVDAAVKTKAEQVNFRLNEEDRRSIVDELIGEMDARGAFDPPPAPAGEPSVQADPEVREEARQEGAMQDVPAPRKQSWAERHGFGA